MNKIWNILESMGVEEVYDEHPVLLKNEACIRCSKCRLEFVVSTEAIYKQHKRGRDKYICKSCAGKKGWTPTKKEIARNRSLRFWQSPDYAGAITGKAIAREIIKVMTKS